MLVVFLISLLSQTKNEYMWNKRVRDASCSMCWLCSMHTCDIKLVYCFISISLYFGFGISSLIQFKTNTLWCPRLPFVILIGFSCSCCCYYYSYILCVMMDLSCFQYSLPLIPVQSSYGLRAARSLCLI